MTVSVPNRCLCFIGGMDMHASSIGVICISMESTLMELSLGDMTCKVCRSFLSEHFDNENYENV